MKLSFIYMIKYYAYNETEVRLPIPFRTCHRLHKNFPKALLWETYFCCLCLRIHIPTQFSEKVIIYHTWYTFSYIRLSVNLYIHHVFDEFKEHRQHLVTTYLHTDTYIIILYEWENIRNMRNHITYFSDTYIVMFILLGKMNVMK